MSNRHLITVEDVSNEDLDDIFRLAHDFKKEPRSHFGDLSGFVVALLFFEPSTRTYLSFGSAAQRLGAGLIGFTDPDRTSVAKGETLEDTIRVVQTFADIIVIRHPMSGAGKQAAALADVPIINGGDGANEHPTQTLYDLFTIDEIFGRIESLDVGFIGDLRYGRTIVSLSSFLSRFPNSLHFIGPEEFQIRTQLEHQLLGRGAKVVKHRRLADVIGELDILYVSRPQQERWTCGESLERLERVTPQAIDGSRPGLAVMHALPRTDELSVELDSDPRARYFHQVSNAVPVRTAVLLRSMRPE
jgi:aspartate carbamoyltransferase catalytic subunit